MSSHLSVEKTLARGQHPVEGARHKRVVTVNDTDLSRRHDIGHVFMCGGGPDIDKVVPARGPGPGERREEAGKRRHEIDAAGPVVPAKEGCTNGVCTRV